MFILVFYEYLSDFSPCLFSSPNYSEATTPEELEEACLTIRSELMKMDIYRDIKWRIYGAPNGEVFD